MGWLRSRWTVVALVPACFLVGFGLVSALADGPDDGSTPEAAQPSGDATVVVTVTGQTDGSAGATNTGSTTTGDGGAGQGGGTATTAGAGRDGGGGGGGVPDAPPPGVIDVDYGQWEGMFELASPAILPDFAQASVTGELRYLGGVDCQVGLVRVKGWLFGDGGLHVGTTVWEST